MPNKNIQLAPGITIRRKRKRYQIRFYDPAREPQRIEQSLRTDNLTLALERGRDMQRRYELGTFNPWVQQEHDLTLQEALKAYRRARSGSLRKTSLVDIEWIIDHLEARTGIVRLRSIEAHHIRDLVYQPHLSQASQGSYWRRLSVFFGWITKAGYLDTNPVAAVDRPKPYRQVPKYFTEEEVDRLVAAVEVLFLENRKFISKPSANPLWCADVYDLVAGAGLRRAEAERLTWGDVVWPKGDNLGLIVVRSRTGARTKSGDDGIVTMLPRAERRLHFLQEQRTSEDPNEPVLKGPDGHSRICGKYASRRFSVYCKRAGLPNITLHGLRHSFAAQYILRGGSLRMLQDEMRHADIQTTMKYANIGLSDRARSSLALFAKSA